MRFLTWLAAFIYVVLITMVFAAPAISMLAGVLLLALGLLIFLVTRLLGGGVGNVAVSALMLASVLLIVLVYALQPAAFDAFWAAVFPLSLQARSPTQHG